MNIVFIVKVKILSLLEWSYLWSRVPVVLTIDSRIVNKSVSTCLVSSKHVPFGVPLLECIPKHIPLPYTRWDYDK